MSDHSERMEYVNEKGERMEDANEKGERMEYANEKGERTEYANEKGEQRESANGRGYPNGQVHSDQYTMERDIGNGAYHEGEHAAKQMRKTNNSNNTAISPFNAEEFRQHGYKMVDFIADYHRNIESFPVRSQVEPGYLEQLLPESTPEDPETLEDILADVETKIFPGLTNWQSPSFFAYYPGNSSTASCLGDMLSGALGVIGFNWISSPAATELEIIVMNWLGKLLQLPNEFLSPGKGGGVIQGTVSEALLVVLLAARDRIVDKLIEEGHPQGGDTLSKLVTYSTDQTHACVQKACQIAGVAKTMRVLPTDSSTNYGLSPAVFSEAVAEDIANGLVPFFLCATVGTTSSAAVDPLPELGEIAKKHDIWFHVDGAYAASACICPEFRHHLDGVEKADSLSVNAHKWLLTNFDCSALWVKDSKSLIRALSTKPEYLRNKATDEQGVVDFKDWQIPLGRRFRSLKLWFVLRMYGVSGLRSFIRNHIESAKRFESLVRSHPSFEVVTPRNFSLVCFRLRSGLDDKDNGNKLNNLLMEKLNNTGKIFLTHTILSGKLTLRMAIGGSQTQLRHVEDAWSLILSEAGCLSQKPIH